MSEPVPPSDAALADAVRMRLLLYGSAVVVRTPDERVEELPPDRLARQADGSVIVVPKRMVRP